MKEAELKESYTECHKKWSRSWEKEYKYQAYP